MGVKAAVGETSSLTGEFDVETHRDLQRAQAHPLGNQRQKGPICLWVVKGVTEIQQRVEQAPILPIGPSLTYSITAQLTSVTPPW